MVADTKDNLSAILSSSPSTALPTKRRLESETDSDFDDEQGCSDALIGWVLSQLDYKTYVVADCLTAILEKQFTAYGIILTTNI